MPSSKRKLSNEGKEDKRKNFVGPRASNVVSPKVIAKEAELKPARKVSSENVVAAKKRSETVKTPAKASKANQQQHSSPLPKKLPANNQNIVWTSDSSLMAAFEAKPLPLQEEKPKKLKPANIKIVEPKKKQSKSDPKLTKTQTSSNKSKEVAVDLRKKSSGKSDSSKPLAICSEPKEKSKEKKAVVSPFQVQTSKSPEMLQEVTARWDLDEENNSLSGNSSSLGQKQNSDSNISTNRNDDTPTVFEKIAVEQRPANVTMDQKPSPIVVDEDTPTVFERIDGSLRPYTPPTVENKQKLAAPQAEAACSKPAEKKEEDQTPKSPSNDEKPVTSVYMPVLPSYF